MAFIVNRMLKAFRNLAVEVRRELYEIFEDVRKTRQGLRKRISLRQIGRAGERQRFPAQKLLLRPRLNRDSRLPSAKEKPNP